MFCEFYDFSFTKVKRTLLLDRDNTLIKDEGYFHDADSIYFLDTDFRYIELLSRNNVAVFIISNQSGIGRGIFDAQHTFLVNKKISEFWKQNKGRLNGAFFCPHEPELRCLCRKPQPTMLEAALAFTGSSRSDSLFIGDSDADFHAAQNANIPFIRAKQDGINTLIQDWI